MTMWVRESCRAVIAHVLLLGRFRGIIAEFVPELLRIVRCKRESYSPRGWV